MLVAKKKYSYDDYKQLGERESKKNIKKNKKKKNKNLALKVSALLWMLMISAALILVLLGYTAITEAEYSVYSLNKEIKQLEDSIQDTKAELGSLTRSDIIEKIATEELGMQYPDYRQITSLNIYNEEDSGLTALEDHESINKEFLEKEAQDKNLSYYFKISIKKLYSLLD